MLMENSLGGSFAKTGQALADKAADKAQSGIRAAQDATKDAGNILSAKLEDVRSEAGTVVSRSSRRARAAGKQGLDAITDVLDQARDVASTTSDSIVAYTKKHPLKALAIAATSGALLYAAVKTLSSSRD
jgi:ElaB/YqjD/DUF883 family membrane-anchored ribosome-binding protein